MMIERFGAIRKELEAIERKRPLIRTSEARRTPGNPLPGSPRRKPKLGQKLDVYG